MLAEIDDHKDRFPSVAVTLPWRKPDGEHVTVRLLMTREDGRLYTGDLFTKVVWQGAFRAAEIAYRGRADGMHALRHFFASTLLSHAVSIKELAEYLGHSDAGFTLRTYTHLVPVEPRAGSAGHRRSFCETNQQTRQNGRGVIFQL